MADHISQTTRENYRLTIYQDLSPESPREWDNLGTMVCAHRSYKLGDEQAKNTQDYSSWEDWASHKLPEDAIMLPLYLMDHSGLSIRTGSGMFQAFDRAGWDWGQVGYIYVTLDKMREEFSHITNPEALKAKAVELLNQEVEIYDQYLQGAVYGYALEKRVDCECCHRVTWELEDSCYGFFGSADISKNGILENLPEEVQALFKES